MGNDKEVYFDDYVSALEKVKKQITGAQYRVLTSANVEKNIMYWRIGKILLNYSEWGSKFIETLSKDLRVEYPNVKGYSTRNLNYMKQFASLISSEEILQQIVAKINWRTIIALINKTASLDEFVWYAKKCLEYGWSSNVLVHQIESELYRRQALSSKTINYKERLLDPLGEQADELIKDPYIFDFLPNATYLKETELENALVERITLLLLEFGHGFAFMGRQFPIKAGEREFFIDLLFYNTKLHCYFVVELKTVEFEPEFAGKLL